MGSDGIPVSVAELCSEARDAFEEVKTFGENKETDTIDCHALVCYFYPTSDAGSACESSDNMVYF